MKLLIFDIDGTLTHLDGATRKAFNLAFTKVFKIEAKTSGLKLHGRTDPVIFQDCFHSSGLTGHWEDSYDRFRPAYIEALPGAIAAAPSAYLQPGIQELLDELVARGDRAALALGTGNMESGARVKIGRFDLNRYFPVGGFGDRHSERPDIMREAVRNAEAHYACSFDPRDTWVIGDTPHDVAGGKAIGVHTLGVATGGAYTFDDLVAAEAEVVLENLADTQRVIRTFGLD